MKKVVLVKIATKVKSETSQNFRNSSRLTWTILDGARRI